MKRIIVAMTLFACGLSLQAHAQTPTTEEKAAPAQTPAPAPLTEIKTRVGALTTIPLNTPSAIDLSYLDIPGVDKELTNGVTVKAYTRYVDYKGQKIGQIVLTGVEKNGQRELLPSENYSAQFNLEQPQLDPGRDVVIKGDTTPIVAALEKLAEEPQQAPEKTVVAQDDGKSPQKQSVSDAAQQNDQAASWQSPDPVQSAEKPVENSYVTENGCGYRPDFVQMRAFKQSKSVTEKNGTLVSETKCSDSFKSVPLDKSYIFCPTHIDLDPNVRLATAQFEYVYIDELGTRVPVKPEGQIEQCAKDPEKAFPIIEKEEQIFLDYARLKAVPQSSLVYLDMNNREIPVRGKQASETKAEVDLVPTKVGCNIRDEFGTVNKSFEQQTYTYTLEGITNQVGLCFDTGTEYPHYKAYTDTVGAALCNAIQDADGRPIGLQSRVAIDVDGSPQYRTPCAPDASAPGVTATTNKCDNPALWNHDLVTGQSLGMERFIFIQDGKEIKLTDCQNSTVVYLHNYETVGWERNDALLYALPKTTVFITPPTGRHDVVVGQVLSGATQQPYQLTGTAEEPTGIPDYPDNSCTKYILTENFESWKRPDNTIHKKSIGAGTPINAGYDCTAQGATLLTDWTLAPYNSGYSTYIASRSGCNSSSWRTVGAIVKYQATRKLVRGDGYIVSTDTQTSSTQITTSSVTSPGAWCSYSGASWNSASTVRASTTMGVKTLGFSPSLPVNPPTGTDVNALKANAPFLF